VRTITQPGTTVHDTVTAPAPAPPPQPTSQSTAAATTTAAGAGTSGADLNNAGYSKMLAGDYTGALPLLEQAVQKLSGTGSTDEAYADYNLAYTRYALGQCTDVLTLLDQSQAIQGHRPEIDKLRGQAKKTCGG
jgi:TolA-binding protein